MDYTGIPAIILHILWLSIPHNIVSTRGDLFFPSYAKAFPWTHFSGGFPSGISRDSADLRGQLWMGRLAMRQLSWGLTKLVVLTCFKHMGTHPFGSNTTMDSLFFQE